MQPSDRTIVPTSPTMLNTEREQHKDNNNQIIHTQTQYIVVTIKFKLNFELNAT